MCLHLPYLPLSPCSPSGDITAISIQTLSTVLGYWHTELPLSNIPEDMTSQALLCQYSRYPLVLFSCLPVSSGHHTQICTVYARYLSTQCYPMPILFHICFFVSPKSACMLSVTYSQAASQSGEVQCARPANKEAKPFPDTLQAEEVWMLINSFSKTH